MSAVAKSAGVSLHAKGKGKKNSIAKVDLCAVMTTSAAVWDTSQLFDANIKDPTMSAIDQFFAATRNLNILLPVRTSYSSQLGHLVLLGHMSATESYFRTMIRRAILIDKLSQHAVHDLDINFAAAQHHRDPKLLPEALFEKTSFSSSGAIANSFKSFLGIKGDPPLQVQTVLGQFSKVCQLRHCLVHRFGKLGSRNAVHLGIDSHKALLEKPLSVGYDDIQIAFDILRQCVTVVNNHVFFTLVTRIPDWKGVWAKDKKLFSSYYMQFATTTDSPPSDQADKVYASLGLPHPMRK